MRVKKEMNRNRYEEEEGMNKNGDEEEEDGKEDGTKRIKVEKEEKVLGLLQTMETGTKQIGKWRNERRNRGEGNCKESDDQKVEENGRSKVRKVSNTGDENERRAAENGISEEEPDVGRNKEIRDKKRQRRRRGGREDKNHHESRMTEGAGTEGEGGGGKERDGQSNEGHSEACAEIMDKGTHYKSEEMLKTRRKVRRKKGERERRVKDGKFAKGKKNEKQYRRTKQGEEEEEKEKEGERRERDAEEEEERERNPEVEEEEEVEEEVRRNIAQADFKAEHWTKESQEGVRQESQEGGRQTARKAREVGGRKGKATWENLLSLLLVLSRFGLGLGKYIEGTMRTTENWAFLTRFCFLSMEGTYSFDIEYDVDFAVEKILLYYDSPNQWPAVYKSGKTCLEKEAVMKKDNNQFINLTLISGNSECEVLRPPGGKAKYHCQGSRSFRSVRERWWFIAISNCESDKGLQLKYRFTMTNGRIFWYKHFSADEFYILRTNLTALGLHLGLMFLSLLAAAELKTRQLFHTTYRLFICAMVLHISSIVFCSLHYARYGYDGMGFPNSLLTGRVLSACSTVVMVLLLLLMGKGFNITRGRLRETSAVRLTVFMSIFTVTYASLFIYERNLFDPGEVLYIYESPAGYSLVGLRLVGWFMLLYACFFTLKHYPQKGNFYYPFFTFYTLWFLSGPVIILVSNHVIDKWVREKVVNGVELGVTFLGHAFFLFLTRPNAANKNFPYHVRTSQINVMKHSATGIVGNNTMDAFAAHPYAPDIPNAALDEPKNFTTPDIFLVSGAVEMRPIPQLQNPTTTTTTTSTSTCRPPTSYPHHPSDVPPSLFNTKLPPPQAPPPVNPKSMAKQLHYQQQQQQHQQLGQQLEGKTPKQKVQTPDPPPSYPYHELQLASKDTAEEEEEEEAVAGKEELEETQGEKEEGGTKREPLPALKAKPKQLPPLQLRPLDEMYDFSSKKFNSSS